MNLRPLSFRAGSPVAVACLAAVLSGCSTPGSINAVSDASRAPASSAASSTTAPPAGGSTPLRSSTTTGRATTSTPEPDETSTTDQSAVKKACDLVTEADATEAFGEPAVAGDQRTDECWWSTANDLKTINLIRREGDIDTWRSGYQNEYWEEIDLGDEGYAGKALDSITFRLGETVYEINVVFSTAGDPKAVVKSLADKVASRL